MLQLICIFDADMVCQRQFFLRTLQWLAADEGLTIVNTPHAFHNIDLAADVHAHSNFAFWHVVSPELQLLLASSVSAETPSNAMPCGFLKIAVCLIGITQKTTEHR